MDLRTSVTSALLTFLVQQAPRGRLGDSTETSLQYYDGPGGQLNSCLCALVERCSILSRQLNAHGLLYSRPIILFPPGRCFRSMFINLHVSTIWPRHRFLAALCEKP